MSLENMTLSNKASNNQILPHE